MPQVAARFLHLNQIPSSLMSVKSKNIPVSPKNLKSNSKLNFCIPDYQNNFYEDAHPKLKNSNIYTNENRQPEYSSRKKSKDFKPYSKSISKKLFQRAKIISNPLRETYLSPQSHVGQSRLGQTQLKISENDAVSSRLTKARSEKKLNINILPKQKIIEKQQNIKICIKKPLEVQKKPNSCQEENQLKLCVDISDIKNIVQNNLFTSQNGLLMLQSLERNLHNISQVTKKDHTINSKNSPINTFTQQNKKLSDKLIKVSKVQSIQVDESPRDQQQKQQQKRIEMAMKKRIKQLQKFRGSLSKLIMGSQFTRRTSQQVELSDLLDQSSVN